MKLHLINFNLIYDFSVIFLINFTIPCFINKIRIQQKHLKICNIEEFQNMIVKFAKFLCRE